MQGYKASAKTPTAALLFDIWVILNFEEEDQRVQKQMIRQNAENIRVGNLENRQKRYERNQTWLLAFVAAGTLVAAFYYGLEIWKYLHPN
jgi:hypothetical protein